VWPAFFSAGGSLGGAAGRPPSAKPSGGSATAALLTTEGIYWFASRAAWILSFGRFVLPQPVLCLVWAEMRKIGRPSSLRIRGLARKQTFHFVVEMGEARESASHAGPIPIAWQGGRPRPLLIAGWHPRRGCRTKPTCQLRPQIFTFVLLTLALNVITTRASPWLSSPPPSSLQSNCVWWTAMPLLKWTGLGDNNNESCRFHIPLSIGSCGTQTSLMHLLPAARCFAWVVASCTKRRSSGAETLLL
jgi:hypothetical protein